jgi:hypothetical protein
MAASGRSQFADYLFADCARPAQLMEIQVGDSIEQAHDAIREAHHAHQHGDAGARNVAVLVSVLAAILALAGVGEKSAQNAYLTFHIAASDDWSFYQAKNVRALMRDTEANILESLPAASDAAAQTRIKAAHDYAARMRDDPQAGDGMKQLAERAHRDEAARETAFHRYHWLEMVVGALEIAIVLASVSVVTRIRSLAIGAGAIGAVAALCGLAVAAGML